MPLGKAEIEQQFKALQDLVEKVKPQIKNPIFDTKLASQFGIQLEQLTERTLKNSIEEVRKHLYSGLATINIERQLALDLSKISKRFTHDDMEGNMKILQDLVDNFLNRIALQGSENANTASPEKGKVESEEVSVNEQLPEKPKKPSPKKSKRTTAVIHEAPKPEFKDIDNLLEVKDFLALKAQNERYYIVPEFINYLKENFSTDIIIIQTIRSYEDNNTEIENLIKINNKLIEDAKKSIDAYQDLPTTLTANNGNLKLLIEKQFELKTIIIDNLLEVKDFLALKAQNERCYIVPEFINYLKENFSTDIIIIQTIRSYEDNNTEIENLIKINNKLIEDAKKSIDASQDLPATLKANNGNLKLLIEKQPKLKTIIYDRRDTIDPQNQTDAKLEEQLELATNLLQAALKTFVFSFISIDFSKISQLPVYLSQLEDDLNLINYYLVEKSINVDTDAANNLHKSLLEHLGQRKALGLISLSQQTLEAEAARKMVTKIFEKKPSFYDWFQFTDFKTKAKKEIADIYNLIARINQFNLDTYVSHNLLLNEALNHDSDIQALFNEFSDSKLIEKLRNILYLLSNQDLENFDVKKALRTLPELNDFFKTIKEIQESYEDKAKDLSLGQFTFEELQQLIDEQTKNTFAQLKQCKENYSALEKEANTLVVKLNELYKVKKDNLIKRLKQKIEEAKTVYSYSIMDKEDVQAALMPAIEESERLSNDEITLIEVFENINKWCDYLQRTIEKNIADIHARVSDDPVIQGIFIDATKFLKPISDINYLCKDFIKAKTKVDEGCKKLKKYVNKIRTISSQEIASRGKKINDQIEITKLAIIQRDQIHRQALIIEQRLQSPIYQNVEGIIEQLEQQYEALIEKEIQKATKKKDSQLVNDLEGLKLLLVKDLNDYTEPTEDQLSLMKNKNNKIFIINCIHFQFKSINNDYVNNLHNSDIQYKNSLLEQIHIHLKTALPESKESRNCFYQGYRHCFEFLRTLFMPLIYLLSCCTFNPEPQNYRFFPQKGNDKTDEWLISIGKILEQSIVSETLFTSDQIKERAKLVQSDSEDDLQQLDLPSC